MIKEKKNKKLKIVLISSIILVLSLLVISFIQSKKVVTFENVRKIDFPKLSFNTMKQLSELDEYPVVSDSDCLPVEFKKISRNPSQEEVDAILKEASLYKSIPLKEGYTLGRVRARYYDDGPVSPSICQSFFKLGIKENSTGDILEDDDGFNGRFRALTVTKDNLLLVGELLYGEPDDHPGDQDNYPGALSYFQTYLSYLPFKRCISVFGTDLPMQPCARIIEEWPIDISDGDVTQNADGTITLHRFRLVGPGLGSVQWIEHNQIHLSPSGEAKLESIKLAELDTGISY